jgi:hypothetical protein
MPSAPGVVYVAKELTIKHRWLENLQRESYGDNPVGGIATGLFPVRESVSS